MICKSLEGFIISRHGDRVWTDVRRAAGFEDAHFETMIAYDDMVFAGVLQAASDRLGRSPAALLEDVGTWICTHPPLEPVRRLFRFCGATFHDLLFSLEEMDLRARMALPDLVLPALVLHELGDGAFRVESRWCLPGAGGFVTGVLRVLASEYGALTVIEPGPVRQDGEGWLEAVSVLLYDDAFHAPTAFALTGARQ